MKEKQYLKADNRQTSQDSRKQNRALALVLVLITWLLFAVVACLLFDRRSIVITMNGNSSDTVEYGSSYSDPGFEATTSGILLGDFYLPMATSTVGVVNTGELGTYAIQYKAKFLWAEASVIRTVTVCDTTAPLISLSGSSQATWLNGYAEEGFSAYDLHDGDLTENVTAAEDTGSIIYTVVDSSGNTATAVRTLNYTAKKPSIILLGDEHMTTTCSESFTDPGFTATDSDGNDYTAFVVTESNVKPMQAGEYSVTYSITNSRGETVSATRTVTVNPQYIPPVIVPDGKTIYLTFDDGPGPYTEELLDVLRKYEVKATFFVTNQQPDYIDLIKREHDEGHAVAVHTYCHEYSTIYASDEAFLDDFNKMQEIIKDQTGSYSRLFRFPGGSSNTVSRISPGIMTRLTQDMAAMGYVYFDWNVDSKDAGGAKTAADILQNIQSEAENKDYLVILQHDIKHISVEAVESIILWGLANGYSFRALQLDSPGAHHSLNN